MRLILALAALFLCLHSIALADVTQLWADLSAKRKALASYEQEIVRETTFSSAGHVQTGKSTVTLDAAGPRWRETVASGTGNVVSLFDGHDLFHIEAADYTKDKQLPHGEFPEPSLYDQSVVDLKKGKETGRTPCGLGKVNHECVVIDIPVRGVILPGGSLPTRVVTGKRRLMVDTFTGLILVSQTVEERESRDRSYGYEVKMSNTHLTWNGPVNESLFQLPATLNEVKEFARWDYTRMKKEFTGKPFPDVTLTPLSGAPLKLSELKGKAVLLDFWTTWCGPCRADGPALNKLFEKYGGKNLEIVGISVDEDRATVQKFLSEHPHAYPIVLTSENEMPRAYQINEFPTYVIIDPDGNFVDATAGTSGFATLKKLLKRAGMDTD